MVNLRLSIMIFSSIPCIGFHHLLSVSIIPFGFLEVNNEESELLVIKRAFRLNHNKFYDIVTVCNSNYLSNKAKSTFGFYDL